MPLRIHHLAIVFAIAVAVAGCSSSQNDDNYQIHLKNSRAYLRQGQYRAALIEARNAHQKAPDNIDTQLLMAHIYADLGNTDSALRALDNIKDDNSDKYVLLKGRVFNLAEKHRSALNYLKEHPDVGNGESAGAYQLEIARAELGLAQLDKARATAEAIGDDKRVEASILLARIDAAGGKLDKAQSALTRVLQEQPDNTDALLLAGMVAKQRDDLSRAEDYLTSALSALPTTDIMLPQRAATLRLLSATLTLENRPSEALVYSKLLAEANPTAHEAEMKLQKARDLIGKGELDKARAILQDLFDQYHSRTAGALLGVVNYLQGNLKQATDMLSTNLDPETASDQALALLAQAQLQLHDIDDVVKLLGPEVANRKSDPRLLALLGLAKLAKGDEQSGVEDLRKSIKLQPDNSFARLALITYYNQIGKPQTALQEAKLAYTYKPSDPQYQRAVLQQLLNTGQLLDARQTANEIAANNPKQAASQLLAGITWYRLGDYDHATKLFEAASKLEPDNVSIKLWNGQLLMARKEPKQARAVYKAIIDAHPDQIVALKGLFTTYEMTNELQPGLDALWHLGNGPSKLGNPQGVLAEYYLRHGDWQTARKYVDPALKDHPNNGYLRELALSTYSTAAADKTRSKNYDEAKSLLSTALNLAPDNLRLQMQLAGVEIAAGNYPAVEESIAHIRPDHPAAAQALQGDLAAARGDWIKASGAYRKSWEQSPNPAIAESTYRALLKVNQDQAGQFLDSWSKKLPGDASPFAIRALQAQKAGDNDKAVKDYQAVLDRDPNNVIALNNLAWLFHEMKRPDAIDYAKRAYRAAPKSPAVLDTYGWILLKSGNKSEAVKILEQASKLSPDSKEISEHLKKAHSA